MQFRSSLLVIKKIKNYLTNHKVSMAPMESKITKNTPLKLLNKLYKKGISGRFT